MGNNITRSIAPKSLFEDASAVTSATEDYDQGDLLIFDDALNVIKRASAEADCATFLGIARATVIDGKVKSPTIGTAVDAAVAKSSLPGPVYGVVAKLTLKTGDSINPGDKVYWDGNQQVTVSGTKAIGVYQGKAIATAAAGTMVECLIGCRHPSDSLQF